MLKKIGMMGVLVLLAIVLAWNPLYSEVEKVFKKGCCIAGTYKGFHQDLASATCKEPEKGPFTMVIYQDKNCGSRVWGKVQGENPEAMKFEGTVTWQSKGCCLLVGVIRESPSTKPILTSKPFIAKRHVEQVEVKATICKKGGKWVVKDGKYKHSGGCNGTFTMEQSIIPTLSPKPKKIK